MNELSGLPEEIKAMLEAEENKKSSPTAKIIKGAVLGLVIILAALAVSASVIYSRYVTVEDGQRIIDLTSREVSSGDAERLRERFPDAQVLYNVDIGGLLVRNDETSLTLTDGQGVTADGLIAAAAELPCITQLNLLGLTVSIEQYEALCAAFPRAKIEWVIPVAGGLSPDVIGLQVKDMDTLRQVLGALKYMPGLTRIDLSGVYLTAADAEEILAAERTYGVEIIWSVIVAGEALPYNTTSLTLSGPGVTDLTELYRLPMLAELTLDGVSVTDLSPLVSITTLESITLRNMSVEGIDVLGNMHWLGSFFVKNTNVTYAQLNALQRRLPECIIMRIE